MPYGDHNREDGVRQVGPGWKDLVLECFDLCDQSGMDYTVVQIKEKFGSLRFYVHFHAEEDQKDQVQEMFRSLREVTGKSHRTCEMCGEPGRPASSPRGYRLTLCDKHAGEQPNQWGGMTTWRHAKEREADTPLT